MQDNQGDVPTSEIAGFWRRLAAFVVDGIILGSIGLGLGAMMFDDLVRMGAYGRLLGFVISLAYFGSLNSTIGIGRTLGKRLLGIQVVGRDGAMLSLPRAMARCRAGNSVLSQRGIVQCRSAFLGLELSAFSTGFWCACFDHLFVCVQSQDTSITARSRRRVIRCAASFRGTSAVVPNLDRSSRGRGITAGRSRMCSARRQLPFKNAFFKEMMPAYEAVSRLPDVQIATVNVGYSSMNGGPRNEYVSIQLRLDAPRIGDARYAEKAAQTVFASYPAAASKSRIYIQLVYGYDIGIASSWKSHSYEYDPRQLAAQAKNKRPKSALE